MADDGTGRPIAAEDFDPLSLHRPRVTYIVRVSAQWRTSAGLDHWLKRALGLGPVGRFVVADVSMTPALEPGDRLFVWRWPWWLRPGQVVVLHDPELPTRFLVKRLAEQTASRSYVVRGDNAAMSRDSRSFGSVGRPSIVGLVVWRYLPGERRGRVGSWF